MVKRLALNLKKLSTQPVLERLVRSMNSGAPMEEMEHDIYMEAAIYEVVAFLARRDAKRAREAAMALDPFWVDLETPEDFLLVFDKI
jgi:hypothetical protein